MKHCLVQPVLVVHTRGGCSTTSSSPTLCLGSAPVMQQPHLLSGLLLLSAPPMKAHASGAISSPAHANFKQFTMEKGLAGETLVFCVYLYKHTYPHVYLNRRVSSTTPVGLGNFVLFLPCFISCELSLSRIYLSS